MTREDQLKEIVNLLLFKGENRSNISGLMLAAALEADRTNPIKEAAEVMREALEKYEEPSNWYSDSSLENGVVYVTEVWKCAGFGNQTAQIALAKAKELMGE